jgi:predicted nuclease of predicted toxin-antitoxin system
MPPNRQPLWLDAHLSPSLAAWIETEFSLRSASFHRLGFQSAPDFEVFQAAREADAIILTKDADFAELLAVHGAPPRIIWLTFGNTSSARLREVLHSSLMDALSLIGTGEVLVEIAGD